jgi:hypothetical protein
MKRALGLAALLVCFSAQAMIYFLEAQWTKGGDRFCRYSNGVVLNVGVKLCPLQIKG